MIIKKKKLSKQGSNEFIKGEDKQEEKRTDEVSFRYDELVHI